MTEPARSPGAEPSTEPSVALPSAPQAPAKVTDSDPEGSSANPALHGGAAIPTVKLGTDRFAVYRRVMQRARGRFRACFEGALGRHEDIPVSALEFVIAADGHVEKTSFDSGQSPFERCMATTLKSLRFPEQSGRVTIRYPLNELPH